MKTRTALVALGAFAISADLLAQDPIPTPPGGDAGSQLVCPPPTTSGTGPWSEPGEQFDREHFGVSAGVCLQGNAQSVKYAPVMVPWNRILDPLDTDGNAADFQTVYVINNPDMANDLVVDIEFYDTDGVLSATLASQVVPAGGHIQRQVSDSELGGPRGMICVRAKSESGDAKFVGSTIYYATQVIDPFDPDAMPFRTGRPMATMQPLQEVQGAANPEVTFGPIPVRTGSGIDSLNGLFSFLNVCNPSDKKNDISVTVYSPLLPPSTTQYTIAANGTLTLYDSWLYALNAYSSLTADHDIVVRIKSTSKLPILGEAIMLDLYEGDQAGDSGSGGPGGALVGPGGSSSLTGAGLGELWDRVRMSSMMLAYTPTDVLINPEIVDGTGVEPIQTTMGISNVSNVDAGPVIVDYFGPDGMLLGTDTIASLPQYASVVLGPGLFASPNFPGGIAFKASAHVRTCSGQIIGWANRASESEAIDLSAKMWGELLHGAGGKEHAPGWIEGTTRRKIAPLVLHDALGLAGQPLSSYVTFANHNAPTTNAYAYMFFEPTPTPVGSMTGLAAFTGLPFRTTSFSYLESLITQPSPTNGGTFGSIHHHHGVIANRNGYVDGISTIGGPLQFFLQFTGDLPNYPGPGDTL